MWYSIFKEREKPKAANDESNFGIRDGGTMVQDFQSLKVLNSTVSLD